MFDVFGAEMPLAVRFFLAFLIVLGLIGAAAWAVRRFGSTRLGGVVRGRQPRLGVIDFASVDARRRLILVRRDNVEHLLMIGGPTDVVVESNIVRAARDATVARPPSAAEVLPRPIPLPEASNGSGGAWPLQPEAPMPPPRRPRAEPIPEEPANLAPSHGEPPALAPRDTLADDLSAHPVAPVTPVTPAAPRQRAPVNARPPAPPVSAEAAAAADHGLAEMAQRLEAALRKPKAEAAAAAARPAPAPEHIAVSESETAAETPALPLPPAPLRVTRATDGKATRGDGKAKDGKLYDTLEQEMASLLGRPPGKSG